MAKGCEYVNEHGVKCGLPPHPESIPHESHEQLVEPDPFCIRATDPFALATIRAWIVCAKAHGVDTVKVQRAEVSFREIERWQRSHGTRLPS
jgi:hypothetical protein